MFFKRAVRALFGVPPTFYPMYSDGDFIVIHSNCIQVALLIQLTCSLPNIAICINFTRDL